MMSLQFIDSMFTQSVVMINVLMNIELECKWVLDDI